MAVVIETTIGDFTVDLFIDSRPQACKNFLKLCKMKYYNFCLFHSVQPNFLAQTGDPSGTGSGGESIYGLLYGENARYFEAETMPKVKHTKPALLSMVNCGNNMLGSQFFITLGEDLVSLDEHCVFGEISEGAEIVLKLNEAICDSQHRPYKDIRITHTIILEDPFDDPSGLIAPEMSPEATQERLANGRIGADEEVDETQGLTAEQVEELRQEREAKARATILEIVGDLPDAEMAPPENVLFVCKLNPVTTDDDLEIIFSRFGKVKSCEVIRDKNTGDSLQYAFVEFEEQKACEEAYFKMDNVLIDDRRIHVDFSQSVSKMRWRGKGRGVDYFDNKDPVKESRSTGNKEREGSRSKMERSSRRERERDCEERDRRKDRGRDRDDDRSREKERERGRDSDDRHRRRDDRDRSRSDWRKREKRDYRDDDKRFDKRREVESSRKRDEDAKRVSSSSSRKGEDKRPEPKRSEEKRIDVKGNRSMNGKTSSRQYEFENSESVEKPIPKIEKPEIGDREKNKSSKYNSPLHVLNKDETLSDSFNDSQDIQTQGEDSEKSLSLPANKDISEMEGKNNVSRRSSNDDKKQDEIVKQEDFDNDRISEGRSSQRSDKKVVESKISQEKEKKKSTKRKRKSSESRKRKKRRHSSSSESSSESSESSDSSSSSDSSDYKHSKKKKLIVAKRYYRGGKLVKEIKKKKRAKVTSDSESGSEESSDSDSRRKYKSKKRKKETHSSKLGKKKSIDSTDGTQSEDSSSSEDSDERNKKRKKRVIEKNSKKKCKHSSKKKKRRKNYSSSSSDSEDSVQSKSHNKKLKKKNLKHSTNLVTTTSE